MGAPAKVVREITDADITTPAGDFAAKYYVVERTQDDGSIQTTHAWFAKDLPGPPVFMKIEAGGQTVFSMELVAHQ